MFVLNIPVVLLWMTRVLGGVIAGINCCEVVDIVKEYVIARRKGYHPSSCFLMFTPLLLFVTVVGIMMILVTYV